MPVPDYGVLKGHPASAGLRFPASPHKPPHLIIDVDTGDATFHVAVNVESQDQSEVLFLIQHQFQPPDVEGLLALEPGRTLLDVAPGGLAVDFLRQHLVTREQMRPLPLPGPGHPNDLHHEISFLVHAAIQEEAALIYAFGSEFPDGIHDIHMNQGNPRGPFLKDNAPWQDGAVFLFFPSQQRWVGIFLAFQTQSFTTDGAGNPADTLTLETAAAPAHAGRPVAAAAPTAAAPAVPGQGRWVPRHFAAVRPSLAQPFTTRPDGRGRGVFQPLPEPTRPAPFRMDLAEILPPDDLRRVTAAGRLVFHIVGDTGNAGETVDRELTVAYHMERQFHAANAGDRPAFFYHLGDVVYFHGEEGKYATQFFDVYDHYPAPIVAIPGNHDGDVDPLGPAVKSLAAFGKHFCAREPSQPPAAQRAVRDAMTQPNPYWTLTTPLLTIVGLYTNVPDGGQLDPEGERHPQEEWFLSELKAADPNKALLVALHHPLYSLDRFHGSGQAMIGVLDRAIAATKRVPDAVFCGHVHNYQRFTRHRDGRHVPHVVAGCGGYPSFHPMVRPFPAHAPTPWEDVTLEQYQTTRKGFLRVTVTDHLLTGEFFIVPLAPEPKDGPTVRFDRFVLDWRQHRLVED